VSEVANSAAEECENSICRCSKRVESAVKLMQQQHFSTTMCKSYVLLTPLSERRLRSYIRPRQSVANDSLSTLFVDSAASTPKASEVSKPCATVLSCITKYSELLNGNAVANVIENTVPNLIQVSGTCSLIPLLLLSQKNALMNEDSNVCTMTLRPRKKAEVDNPGSKASFSCRSQLPSQQTKTSAFSRKEKSRFSKIQGKSRNSKQMSQNADTKVAAVSASNRATRNYCGKRGCRYSKSTSPLLSSHCDRPSGQTGKKYRPNQKYPQASRKRIHSDVSTKPPSKVQKLCKKANVAELIYEQETNNNAAVRRGSTSRSVCPAVDEVVRPLKELNGRRQAAAGKKPSACQPKNKGSRH